MSTPEIPDFSSAASPEPSRPVDEATVRPRRRGLAVAGFATALALGAVGATAFTADHSQRADDVQLASATSSPTAPSGQAADPDRDGDGPGHGGWGMGPGGRPGGPGGPGGLGMMGPRGALHGELVVPQRDGTGTETVVVQTGEVTAVSAKSLSLKSSDGYTATYTISSTTRVAARSGGITSLKKGDTVSVLATKSGSTLTAVMVGARPDHAGPRGAVPTPNPSATGSSSDASNTSYASDSA